jgi:hypothetical protein
MKYPEEVSKPTASSTGSGQSDVKNHYTNSATAANSINEKTSTGSALVTKKKFNVSTGSVALSNNRKGSSGLNKSTVTGLSLQAGSTGLLSSVDPVSTMENGRSFYVSLPERKTASLDRTVTGKEHWIAPDVSFAKPAAIRLQPTRRFYAGIVGAVDGTTIKFQKIEEAGYSYGILLGYQFNRRWSIETGLNKNRKYYYSEGQYFNTSHLYMPGILPLRK